LKIKLPTFPKARQRFNLQRFILVLVVAFILRLFLSFFETEVGVDSIHYILMGDNIAHGSSFDTFNTTGGHWLLPPAFPLLIAFFRLIGFGLEWSGHLASVTAGTFLLLPLYFLTRRLYGDSVAWIAIIIASFFPILVDYSTVILTENLFAAFVLLMLLSVVKAYSKKGKKIDAFWSGFSLSLAFLTKTFGLFLLPFLLISFLCGRGGNSKNKGIHLLGIALLGFLILAVPYWIGLRAYTGQWVIDGKGMGQASRIYATSLEDEHIDPRYTGELTSDGSDFLINENPLGTRPSDLSVFSFTGNYLKKYVQKLIRIYQDFPFTPTYPNNVCLLYLLPAILLGLGIFSGPGTWLVRHRDRFMFYWLIPFVFGLPLVFVEVRYFIPVIPLLIPFMAVGVEVMAEWMVTRFSGVRGIFVRPVAGPGVTIILALFIILATPKLTYKVTNWGDPMVSYNPRKAAAHWLVSNGYHPERIMEYGHSVSFYSGAQSILIPDGDLDDVISIARTYDVDLLSLDEFYVLRADRRPEIEYLFDTDSDIPGELELIYLDNNYAGLKHVIYRIHPVNEPNLNISDPD